MTKEYKMSAAIKPVGEFQVGDTQENKFELSIRYTGQEAIHLEDCSFKLSVDIGPGPTALVLNMEAVDKIVSRYTADIEIDPPLLLGTKACWEITSYSDSPFNKDNPVSGSTDPIKIEFSKIISQTEPGTAGFTLESTVNGNSESQTLNLVKQSAQSGIIDFYSTTEQILPGQEVILKWNVKKLGKLRLEPGGRNLLNSNSGSGKGEIVIEDIREDTDFILSGIGEGDDKSKKSARVSVKVLRSGWHESTKTVDGVKLEPTLLFNANNQTIYAVFRRTSGDDQEGLLFQTVNPLLGWTSINSSVPDDCITSPGVYCDDRLWFIGGSQIDPDNSSNRVHYFDVDLGKREWHESDPAPWAPRMGHTVLAFQGKILVMGGFDQNGNTLDDVWSFDVSGKTWSKKEEMKLPGKRCMFSCAVFNKDIWLCGGLEEDPFSDEFLPDIYVYNEDGWKKKHNGLSFIKGTPVSACLQVFKDKLNVIGKTRDDRGAIEAFNYRLNEPSTDTWETQSCDALKGWGEDMTLSYQLINFKNNLLIAKAMGYETPNNILKIYIPRE